jgi:hypothetical protein
MNSVQPEPTTPAIKPGRVFHGWWMLGIISLMGALNNAFFDKGPAVFLIPVGREWSPNEYDW